MPNNHQQAAFAMGCFWGVEKLFSGLDGVSETLVGYTAGVSEDPTYEQVCTGATGHSEAVLVRFDASVINYETLLKIFWINHNPTQGMQQGNDIGTQYRSAVYFFDDKQQTLAEQTRKVYQTKLSASGFGKITTEITSATQFYPAEDCHQKYLIKNPNGYCALAGTGVDF